MESEPHVVRVATYNARHGVGPFGLVSHRGLIDSCRVLDADVLALQELDRRVVRSYFRDQPKLIGRALPMRVVTAPAKRTPVGGWQCNAIATRGELTAVDIVELPRQNGHERRVAVFARVELPGRALTVACTHLESRSRDAAAVQLDFVLDTLDERPAPQVVAGDFNLGSEVVEPALAARGFIVAPSEPTFPAHAPRSRTDWIAVAGGSVVATQVHRPAVGDHRPLVADIVITGDASGSAVDTQ
ncbi:MAG: endonuclease/exonuclease/phosphatase family protein [Actinomycetota bacterium]